MGEDLLTTMALENGRRLAELDGELAQARGLIREQREQIVALRACLARATKAREKDAVPERLKRMDPWT